MKTSQQPGDFIAQIYQEYGEVAVTMTCGSSHGDARVIDASSYRAR